MLRSCLKSVVRRPALTSLVWRRSVVFTKPGQKKSYEASLDAQFRNLDRLTKKVKGIIAENEEQAAVKEVKAKYGVQDEIDYDANVENDAQEIFEALNEPAKPVERSQEEMKGLFPSLHSYVSLPAVISDQLDEQTLSCIASEKTTNWVPVLNSIESFKGCSSYDAHRLLSKVPKSQRPQVIDRFLELAQNAHIMDNTKIYNEVMATYNLSHSHDKVKQLYGEMAAKKLKPDIFTYGILISMYSRECDVAQTRKMLHDVKTVGEPTLPIYTSVLQMYVRMNEYENALDVFDTMKFLSTETFPASRTYSSMILLDTLHDNIEHGIALYEEMKDHEIKIEAQALLALAKGCSTRKQLVQQGWNFILEYYAMEFPISYKLIEIMMSLAAKEGDIQFARALYLSVFESNTRIQGQLAAAPGVCLKYLFNSYYYNNPREVPTGLVEEHVRAIRTSSLEMMNFGFSDQAPPLLPTQQLNPTLVLQECTALMQYHFDRFPKMVSRQVVEAYLFVVGKKGSIEDFEHAWETYTYFEEEGLTDTRKIARDDRLYNTCMHAARLHKNVEFAQNIWTERGKYRKEASFQNLEPFIQDQQDFKFARSMLSCFVETGSVVDAYQLVLSSQSRFVWTYYHLKSLLGLCQRMGYQHYHEELRKVVKKGTRQQRRR